MGKTTLLKLLIQRLLQEGANPASLFYHNAELIAIERELFSLFKAYKEFAPPEKCIVFFDEITAIARWEWGNPLLAFLLPDCEEDYSIQQHQDLHRFVYRTQGVTCSPTEL